LNAAKSGEPMDSTQNAPPPKNDYDCDDMGIYTGGYDEN